jgi:CRP-like cAMP-binding protein
LQQEFLAAASWREYGHGDVVLRPGEVDYALYAVVSGMVKHSYLTVDGEESLGWIFWPGDWFNAMALIDGQALNHRTHAAGTACLLRIPGSALGAMTKRQPMLYRNLACICTRNFRAVAMRLTEVGLLKPEQRIAQLLIDIDSIRNGGEGESAEPLHITQQELCELLLLSRSTASKVLGCFSSSGWIRHRYGRIRILDPVALLEVAGKGDREPRPIRETVREA